MNPAIAMVIGAVVTGLVAIIVAVINAIIGRGGRRADIADKVTEAWERTGERLDKEMAKLEAKCDKCESRLSVTERRLADAEDGVRRGKAALRALIRVIDSKDPVAIAEAVTAARELT